MLTECEASTCIACAFIHIMQANFFIVQTITIVNVVFTIVSIVNSKTIVFNTQ